MTHLDKTKMEVMEGTSTGSKFYVIGKLGDLRVGLRLWTERVTPDGYVLVTGFRFRIESDKHKFDHQDKFKKYVSEITGNTLWHGGSASHVSLAGGVKIPYASWPASDVLDGLKKNDVGGRIFDLMTSHLSLFNFDFSRPEFTEYFMSEVNDSLTLLNGSLEDKLKHPLVLDFGKMSQHLKDGKATAAPPDSPIPAPKEQPKATGDKKPPKVDNTTGFEEDLGGGADGDEEQPDVGL